MQFILSVMSRTIPMTMYEAWFKTKPNVDNFKIFGSEAYVHIPNAKSLIQKVKNVVLSVTQKLKRLIASGTQNKEKSTAETPIYYPDQTKGTRKEQNIPPTVFTGPPTSDDEAHPFHGFEP